MAARFDTLLYEQMANMNFFELIQEILRRIVEERFNWILLPLHAVFFALLFFIIYFAYTMLYVMLKMGFKALTEEHFQFSLLPPSLMDQFPGCRIESEVKPEGMTGVSIGDRQYYVNLDTSPGKKVVKLERKTRQQLEEEEEDEYSDEYTDSDYDEEESEEEELEGGNEAGGLGKARDVLFDGDAEYQNYLNERRRRRNLGVRV